MDNLPDNNPKTAFGLQKAPLDLIPSVAEEALAWVLKHGADKYGKYNWRDEGITASVYVAAARRHINEYKDGCNRVEDSGLHPLAHVMACCAIVLDAEAHGKLNDDRWRAKALPTPSELDRLSKEMNIALGRANG